MKPKALTEHDTGMLEFLEDIIGRLEKSFILMLMATILFQ